MNREIKFRAWSRSSGKMHYEKVLTDGKAVICGYEVNQKGEEGDLFIEPDIYHLTEGQNNFTLLQYTGLKDKTGKEIYEGDILKNEKGEIRKIEWNQQQGAFWLMTNWKDVVDFPEPLGNGYFDRKDYEVIGNIYENPNLIQE